MSYFVALIFRFYYKRFFFDFMVLFPVDFPNDFHVCTEMFHMER